MRCVGGGGGGGGDVSRFDSLSLSLSLSLFLFLSLYLPKTIRVDQAASKIKKKVVSMMIIPSVY